MVACSDPEHCCSICLNSLRSQGIRKYNKKIACGHVFHPNCIDTWSQRGTTCPCCRAPLFEHRTIPVIVLDPDDIPLSDRRLHLLMSTRPLRNYNELYAYDVST